MRLFHFSENPDIAEFVPRPVPKTRAPDVDALQGAVVWAIEERHQPMYLFPRDCPRILLWATSRTTDADVMRWLEGNRGRVLAYIERAWWDRVQAASIVRYEFPVTGFSDLEDAGMWVSRTTVRPIAKNVLRDLPRRLEEGGATLRVVDSLLPWKTAWESTVHASGIRLRHAVGWMT